MTFREKMAWVCLLVTVGVWAPYFGVLAWLWGVGEFKTLWVVAAFILAVVVSIVLSVVASIGVAVLTKEEPEDERDRAIESRSFKISYYILTATFFVGMSAVFTTAMAYGKTPNSDLMVTTIVSQFWLFGFVLAESVRYLTLVLGYRRGV